MVVAAAAVGRRGCDALGLRLAPLPSLAGVAGDIGAEDTARDNARPAPELLLPGRDARLTTVTLPLRRDAFATGRAGGGDEASDAGVAADSSPRLTASLPCAIEVAGG